MLMAPFEHVGKKLRMSNYVISRFIYISTYQLIILPIIYISNYKKLNKIVEAGRSALVSRVFRRRKPLIWFATFLVRQTAGAI